MAEKGGTGENVFKLTVKVDLLGNGSNENTIEQLQKSFQKELTHLRQHFRDHAQLHDQLVHHVKKEKRNLGFEFWVKNKEDLEKLKRSIEDNTLAKTLSEYSHKKELHRDLGFPSSEGLCFRCTIQEKQYLLGLLHFTDEASDFDNEGTEEKDPNQSLPLTSRDASVPMGQHHGSKAHTAPVLHGSDAFRGSGVGMHQTSSSSTPLVQENWPLLSASRVGTYTSLPTGQNQSGWAQNAPVLHGRDAFRGSGVGMHQTSSSSNLLVQRKTNQHEATHHTASISAGSESRKSSQNEATYDTGSISAGSESRKSSQNDATYDTGSISAGSESRKSSQNEATYDTGSISAGSESRKSSQNDATYDTGSISAGSESRKSSPNEATYDTGSVSAGSEFSIKKKFYLFLPDNAEDIQEVFLTSQAFTELHKIHLHLVSKFDHLWELSFAFHQSVLDNKMTCQFGFLTKGKSKSSPGKENLDRKCIISGSSVQRLMWGKTTYQGFLTHMKHILQTYSQDVKDSFMQVEELAHVVQKDIKEKVIQDLQEELSDTHRVLMFAVMIAKFSTDTNIESFLDKLNKAAFETLFSVICSFAGIGDIPSTSMERLRWLSYWVIKRFYNEKFCLVMWMKHMFPLHCEACFLSRLKTLPICHNDEASIDLLIQLCEQIRERILRKESQKGEDLLLAIFNQVPLFIGLKVYHHVFDVVDLSGFEKKLKEIMSSRTSEKASQCFNRNAVCELKDMWSDIRKAKFDSEFRSTFEKYVLSLVHKAIIFHYSENTLNQDWCTLCEDEVLFVSGENQKTLLKTISMSSQKEMHKYLIKLADMKKFEKAFNFDIMQLWFHTAVDRHVGDIRHDKPKDNLVQVYCYLCDTLMLLPSRTPKEEEELKNTLFTRKIEFRIKPSDLLKRRDQIIKASRNPVLVSEILNHHVKSLLKKRHGSENPKDIIYDVCHNHLVWDTWQDDIVQFLLEQYEPKGQSEQDMFMSMMSHHDFWKAVMEIQGKFSSKVRSQNVFQLANKSVDFVRNLFINLTVSLEFLKDIVSNKMENKVEALLLTDEFTKEKFVAVLEEYKTELPKEEQKKEIVRSTLQCALKYCPEAKDSGVWAIQKISDAVGERLIDGKISVLELKTLWHPCEILPDICRDLMIPVQSKVFWKKWKEGKNMNGNGTINGTKQSTMDYLNEEQVMQRDELEEQDDTNMMSDVCDMENTVGPHEGLTFLESLSRRGCEMYRNIWNDFFQGNDIPLSTIQEVFRYVKDVEQEIELVENFFGTQLNEMSKSALMSYFNFSKYKNIVHAMVTSISAFNINIEDDEEFKSAVQAFENLTSGQASSTTLFEVHYALAAVEASMFDNNEEVVALLNAFGKSSTLISFLTEIMDEDIRYLIDADEEVSEKYVKESTVSGLIEVKRFLHPFLTNDSKLRQSRTVFFTEFSKKCKESVFKDAVGKTTDCMDNLHNLKALYNNLANRSGRIREIIQNIVQHGKFNFCLRKHECVLTVFYLQYENESTHSTANLVNLRSRALLLMNTARKEDSVEQLEETNEYLKQFVQFINNGLEIAELYTSLHVSGHFKYMEFSEQVEPVCLNDFRLQLEKKLAEWQTDILHCREMHYYMNFLHGFQIQILYSYLETGTIKDTQVIDSFLKFIHPNASIVGIETFYMSLQSDKSNLSVLMNMGIALEHMCKHLTPIRRPMESSDSGIRIMESVQKGKLLIASLHENSKSVIKTVLGLYMNNSKAMPEAHQLLFCHHETIWDEVDLLLKRCLGAHRFGRDDSLFCLANVEMLPNEKQFQLVDALRKLPKDDIFFLAIVFRGAEHHPFLHEFSNCVTHVNPVTGVSFQRCLQNECSKTFTVTSDVPGLGKTESIKRHAHHIKKKCVTLHISGPQSKQTLVERLSNLKVQKNDVLHIDIGNIPTPEEIDTFLFELLVLHYVSAYTGSVFLTTDTVHIEIANTMNNILRDSLHIVTSFKRIHLKWEGFDNLQISSELHSSVQVVCLYLDALENGTLDKKDIVFKGTKALTPLPQEKCKQLLQKTLKVYENDLSYNVINTFVRVLADQLKKLSCSTYFRVSNLSVMLGRNDRYFVKTALVTEMVAVSINFASRSIKSCRESQVSSVASSEQNANLTTYLTERVDGMIRWEDSNHLMFLFHSQDIQTLSALYRDIEIIPDHIKMLFESQMKKKLPDFKRMSQNALQNILQKITRLNSDSMPQKELREMAKYYALTPDNLLKMVLIVLRVRAHIPIIVMGETGCGKTSLIHYISKLCDVDLRVKSIHSGIEEEDIINTVENVNKEAFELIEKKQQIWLFLDEINTNDYLWLISDIICHHSCLGRKLAPNLVLMAACNPYKLRSESSIQTAGLEGRARTDEMSRLLYRVHPLPETMVDYVWDFGSLNKADEKMYIFQMVCGKLGLSSGKEQLFADALVISQEFIRTEEGTSCCVSLRDVRRCADLTIWFKEILNRKKKLKQTSHPRFFSKNEVEVRSIILALAHCYHCRLIDTKKRKEYREALYQAFRDHHENEYKEKKIIGVIREEQKDILDRMELPVGIAKNTALQENVFVILVCILNRIPVFVVGKPGCSKSLSMHVIRSNLRGPDSRDELFQSLPQLYCVSFQGSESSTSEGIIEVFKKAQKYQESNAQEDVLSVVILDGLAEVSWFNPLKVLHSLLEPVGELRPDIAVVGISNWALDASKMNRAIHLSRPEMDEEELYETGKSISDSLAESSDANYSRIILGPERELDIHEELQGIARGYLAFVDKQCFKNFFGLRDYYSLIKYFAKELNITDDEINRDTKGKIILKGIHRNFGGLPLEMGSVRKCFGKHIKVLKDLNIQSNIPVLDLIKENIEDRFARHLLLITSGDSVLGIIEKQLRDLGREHVTIFGSKFEEDLTDDYSYRILSRIILCMEQGLVLILKDLETVYGSLYDMLNQNYTVVGNRKNCRIALGPYSNPMCSVHDDFKCIVLVEESKLDYSDPPFLNRFEKQRLHYSEILGAENESVVSEVEDWISSVSSIPRKHFSREDTFPIYSKDMASSLILQVSSRLPVHDQSLVVKAERCKMTLLEVMKPEAIVRLEMSEYGQNHSEEDVEKLKQSYFSLPLHDGLEHFIMSEIGGCSEGIGKLLVVFTNSNMHTDLKKLMPNLKSQIEKLGAFKSEKQLMTQMEQFWQSSEKELLFLQCKADSDGAHILLSKSIIEKLQSEYSGKDSKIQKHVCLIVHLGRNADESKTVPQIDFLAKWRLVMLDSLDRPRTRLPQLTKFNLMETIELKRPLDEHIKEQLFTAFACIRYGTYGRSIESISEIISKIESCPEFLSYLEISILKWINAEYSYSADIDKWQVQVSCDVNALYTASSLIEALERHISSVIYKPLAMLIYELEKQNLLDCFFVSDSSVQERRLMWNEFFSDEKMFTIGCSLPTGPECYELKTPVVKLHMPFSKLLFERVDAERDCFNELLRNVLQQNAADELEDLDIRILQSLFDRFIDLISPKFSEVLLLQYKNCQMDYMHDFCTLVIAKYSPENISSERISVMYWLLTRGSELRGNIVDACAMVHTTYWTSTHLIMAEFMLIETCRELVDIEDILQEICTPNINLAKNKEDRISFDFAPNNLECVEDGNCTEVSFSLLQNRSAFPKQSSVNYKPDKYEKEATNVDQMFVVEQNITFENSIEVANLTLAEDVKALLDIVSEDPHERNYQLCSQLEYCTESSTQKADMTDSSSTCAVNDLDEYQEGGNEVAEKLGQSHAASKQFTRFLCKQHQIQESLDTKTTEDESANEENSVTADVRSVTYDPKGLLDDGEICDEIISEIESEEKTKDVIADNDQKEIQEELDDAPTLQNILLEKLCKKILPREKILQSNEDLEKWNKRVQSILSIAVHVSKECSVVFALRFCTDLTAHILIPYKMDSFWLVEFGNMLRRDIPMHSEEFLEKVTALLSFLHSTGVTRDDQQKIFSQFILRSLQSSDSRDILDWLFKMVKENRVPDSQLSHLKSSLHYATLDVPQSTLFQIIDSRHEDCFELLQENKNEILFKLDSSIGTPWEPCWQDHPLATLMVDIFENKIFESQLDIDETKKLALAIKRLDNVERMIFEDNFSLKHLLGIAFYRQCIKSIGLVLEKEESSIQSDLLQYLDACLKCNMIDDESKKLSTQIFLLKLLKSRVRFPKFHKLCQDLSSKLTFIASLWKCGSLWKSVDSAPLALYNIDLHQIATDALMVFDVSKGELQHFIKKAVSNCDQMLSLHSVLMQHFYLKRTVSEVTDSERTKAKDIQEVCGECELDEFNFRLIQCHLGIREYEMIDELNLNLHEGSTESDMQISSFIVELASLASSYSTGCNNAFVKCVHEPGELFNVFLPGLDVKDAEYELDQTAVTTEETFVGRCINHHRFAVSSCKVKCLQCPVCTGETVEINRPLSLYYTNPECDGTIHGRNLTAISQHLLQMIIHGLFTASLALGYSKSNDLCTIIKRPQIEENVARYLYQNIQSTFKYLESLMGLKQTDFDYFLHVLLVRTRNLMWENVSSFSEESERDSWEKKINNVINSLVKERFIAVREGKRQVLVLHGFDERAVERQVEEIDEVGWCPCLFRLTMEPSLENLSLELYEGNKADSFPFLALVLKTLPQLELIQHIKPLISWHKACVFYASYRKTKADFKKSDYTVSSFIHEEDGHNRREYLKRKFESCKIAWEAIREKATLLKLPVMDRIHDMSSVESCLILDETSPMYNVIEILISMQNNFLDVTLALSSEKYFPALHFLQKNTVCACVPCVPVADAKRDEIVIFKWSERYLKSSQCNIKCGQGREIKYDFRTIEMELANLLLLGKCYLLLKESFPKMVFTDELYKRYILMIEELKEVIPQKKLTSDIEAAITSKKNKDPKLIADFLAHLGVIISLLRRTGGKPEMPLVQFLDKWNSLLTRPFPRQVLPTPESAIELSHIVHVNELLEELNADGIIDSLEDEYRVHLQGSSLNFIDGFLGRSVMRAEVVLKAEKRFVYKCLLHREAAPTDSLLSYLNDSYFWPDGSLHDGKLRVGSPCVLLLDLFPSDVQVQHIYFYIQFLIRRIEDLKSEDMRITDGIGFSSTEQYPVRS